MKSNIAVSRPDAEVRCSLAVAAAALLQLFRRENVTNSAGRQPASEYWTVVLVARTSSRGGT